MEKPILLKISGHHLEDHQFLQDIAVFVRDSPVPVVIVHGGGAKITEMQQVMGIEPRYVSGLRVTDAESLEMVEMVLCGVVNKRLVRHLVNAGVEAMGLSGVDRGLLRGRQLAPDMGYTGTVSSVRGDLLLNLLEEGITPVIAPVCVGEESNFNVNADTVAGAVAIAVDAQHTIFISNVEGVLVDGQPVRELTIDQANRLIEDGTVFGGMIPKVNTALDVLKAGVPRVTITNLNGLKSHGGTVFVKSAETIAS